MLTCNKHKKSFPFNKYNESSPCPPCCFINIPVFKVEFGVKNGIGVKELLQRKETKLRMFVDRDLI